MSISVRNICPKIACTISNRFSARSLNGYFWKFCCNISKVWRGLRYAVYAFLSWWTYLPKLCLSVLRALLLLGPTILFPFSRLSFSADFDLYYMTSGDLGRSLYCLLELALYCFTGLAGRLAIGFWLRIILSINSSFSIFSCVYLYNLSNCSFILSSCMNLAMKTPYFINLRS